MSDHSVKHSRHLSGHPKKENAGRMPNAASTAQPAGPRAAGSMWLDAVLMIIPALAALAAALRHGPDLIDDAYMTFRYAENLASGCGMVFNRGEAVLGTTTPLMTILLALFKLAGVSIPLAARGLGIVSGMGVVVLMQLLALRSMGRLAAAALAVCIAVHPDLAFALNSGMETGLSTAAVYGALLLMLQGRYIPAGLIGGVAFLLRPDGLLIVLLSVGTAGLRARRRAWQPALAAALVALPWLIYAGLTYGSVIPHSVAAKQLIHPESPLNILAVSVSRLTFGTEMQIACFFAAVGLIVAIRRRSELLLVALWMALYMAGLAAARIALFFPWYLSPLFPGILLFAAFGLDSTAKSLLGKAAAPSMARRAVALGATPLILLTLSGLGLHEVKSWQVLYEAYFGRRIHAYLEIADNLRQRCIPGDVVFVGEAGALAYSMPAQIIVDSSGINSPAVYRARLTDRERLIATGRPFDLAEGSPAWVYDVIKQCHPRYVVTYGAWLHMGTLIRDPQVMSAYHRLPIPGLDDYVVLERTDATK